jgi:hypothetical protein
MDAKKRDDLKARLSAQPEPRVVPVDIFFDGNDDEGSIGCNLTDHPGIDVFRSVLLGILGRADVVAAYAQISEVDPGVEYWPFADWVFVVGTISRGDLANALAPLQPDGSVRAQPLPATTAGVSRTKPSATTTVPSPTSGRRCRSTPTSRRAGMR